MRIPVSQSTWKRTKLDTQASFNSRVVELRSTTSRLLPFCQILYHLIEISSLLLELFVRHCLCFIAEKVRPKSNHFSNGHILVPFQVLDVLPILKSSLSTFSIVILHTSCYWLARPTQCRFRDSKFSYTSATLQLPSSAN